MQEMIGSFQLGREERGSHKDLCGGQQDEDSEGSDIPGFLRRVYRAGVYNRKHRSTGIWGYMAERRS